MASDECNLSEMKKLPTCVQAVLHTERQAKSSKW
jgi:hypothetical protein